MKKYAEPMKQFVRPFIPFIAIPAILLVSCEKRETDSETQSAADNSMAETEFSAIFSTTNNIIIREEGPKKVTGDCFTVTPPDTTAPWPRKLIIDYGNGCLDHDGRLRQGQIDVTISAPWSDYNSQISARLVNYKVNGLVHTGTLSATNLSLAGTSQHRFRIDVDNASIVTNDGTIEWQSTRTIDWLQGFDTDSIRTDDIYDITGSASGVNRKGKGYTVKVTSAIRIDGSCKWIPSGVLELTPDGLGMRKVDFGDGTCDDKAVVTIKGRTYEITMP